MNGDLTQSLGGLRIANPDNEDTTPSPPAAPLGADDRQTVTPPRSSLSSSSTITERQKKHSLSPLTAEPVIPTGSLGFDPTSFSARTTSLPPAQSQHLSTEPQPNSSRLGQQRTPGSGAHTQQQTQYPYSSNLLGPTGSAFPLSGPTSPRPNPSPYGNAGNLPAGPNLGSPGDYPLQNDIVTGMTRDGSTAPGGVMLSDLKNETVHSEGGYRGTQPASVAQSSFPARRSSRHAPPGHAGASSYPKPGYPLGSPYAAEGGPIASSEDWKEKGAAVVVRQGVDSDGRPVSKVVKKGVKDFNFGRTLGEGSYSTVLAATDRQTLREYAIKVLDKRHIIKEKKVKYVNIEKDTLNRLTEHPGIVRLYYTFQDERSLYFVLDLATGGELLGVLKKMGTFDEECTRFYGAEILDAVAYMHSRGVIHRDLKPENVLLDDRMHVKITDFGTAKILDTKSRQRNGEDASAGNPLDGADTDRAVSFVGTAEYVSPELLTDKNACKASDLWAFGCIIYQLLAGRPPFKAGNEYQTFQKIVGLEYAFPEGFPEVARDLVERLLVLDPSKRLPIEHIKNHQFFDGIIWGKGLWHQKAPRLKSYTPKSSEPIKLNGGSSSFFSPNLTSPTVSKQGANTAPTTPASQLKPHPRLITELPPPSQLDIEWSPVLTRTNERILKLGNLIVSSHSGPYNPDPKASGGDAQPETSRKLSRFFGGTTTKKRQRLVMITSSARIVLAAAGGDEKKAKMEISLLGPTISWKSFKDSKGLTAWVVDMREKHITFEDPKATTSDPNGSLYSTQEWLDTAERARELAISHSMTNSYSGESNLNELSSSISSPTSTLGGDAGFDGVNVPSNRHGLRRDDGDSVRGVKRFSRRHSKNGLAAVF